MAEARGRSKCVEEDEMLLFGHLHSGIPMGHPSVQFDEHVWGSGEGSHPETKHLEPSAGRWSLR